MYNYRLQNLVFGHKTSATLIFHWRIRILVFSVSSIVSHRKWTLGCEGHGERKSRSCCSWWWPSRVVDATRCCGDAYGDRVLCQYVVWWWQKTERIKRRHSTVICMSTVDYSIMLCGDGIFSSETPAGSVVMPMATVYYTITLCGDGSGENIVPHEHTLGWLIRWQCSVSLPRSMVMVTASKSQSSPRSEVRDVASVDYVRTLCRDGSGLSGLSDSILRWWSSRHEIILSRCVVMAVATLVHVTRFGEDGHSKPIIKLHRVADATGITDSYIFIQTPTIFAESPNFFWN